MYDGEDMNRLSHGLMARSFGRSAIGMIVGLVPTALAIWLATVYKYMDITGYQGASQQTSQFSEQPIEGARAGIQGGSRRRWTYFTGSYHEFQAGSTSNSILHEGGRKATTCLTLGIHEMSEIANQASPDGGEGLRGDVPVGDDFVYRDRALLGLRSYDFQFANIAFYESFHFGDVIFKMNYRGFSVFSLMGDCLSIQTSLRIARSLYEMVNHAYEVLTTYLSDHGLSILSALPEFSIIKGFVLTKISRNFAEYFRKC